MKPHYLLAACAMAMALTTTACGKSGAPDAEAATTCGESVDLSNVGSSSTSVSSDTTVPDSPALEKMQKRGHVVVGVKADQPGLGYKDASGKRCGIDIEIARLISAGLGFDPASIEYKEIPSANREASIGAGEIDYYVGSYSITDERKELVGFAGPYLVTGQGLLVQTDDEDITGKDTLEGKKVCGATGTNNIQLAKDEQWTEPENIIEFKTGAECVSQLIDGKVDVVTTDEAILQGYAASSPDEVKIVGEPFTTEKYGIGLTHSDKALRDAMNDVLATAVSDGTWNELYDATLGKSGTPGDAPTPERY